MTLHCPHEPDVAAWLLGALPSEDADRFGAHLPSCPVCPPQVVELQGVVDTLPLAAMPVGPPPELKDRIMRTVRAEAELLAAAGPEADRVAVAAPRRRWWSSLSLRPPMAAALACALLALGVVGGVVAAGGEGELRRVPAQVALKAAPQATAEVLVQDDGDARLEVSGMPAPPKGRVYQVWLQRTGSSTPEPTDALFQTHDGRATVQVPGGTEGIDAVLVTHEPDGGSAKPTSIPAIVARLA